MAESSPLESGEEQRLLQAALEHPFEPSQVPLGTVTSPQPTQPAAPPPESIPPESPPTETDTWQSAYAFHVSEWRAQSASARTKAEETRAKWEAIRAREAAEREASGQPPESWDGLGDHITAAAAAASESVSHSLSASVTSLSSLEHVASHAVHEEDEAHIARDGKPEIMIGSPSQRWEHVSSSPTSSYPSMSFPEASVPHSPSPHPAFLVPASASAPAEIYSHSKIEHNQTYVPPSTLPCIMDDRIAPRTRLSLVLSSLAINLLLPFINGVMLGFGEIFAKEVIVGWFGWKRHGSIAARLGLRR